MTNLRDFFFLCSSVCVVDPRWSLLIDHHMQVAPTSFFCLVCRPNTQHCFYTSHVLPCFHTSNYPFAQYLRLIMQIQKLV